MFSLNEIEDDVFFLDGAAEEFTLLVNSDTSINFNILDEYFESLLGPEINKILKLQEQFKSIGHYCVNKDTMQGFLDKLFAYNCPKILKYNLTEQNIFLLYLTSVLFYRYNDKVLKMNQDDFINKLYFINILTICSKFLINGKKFFYKIIKDVYIDVSNKSVDIISEYNQLYHKDLDLIKNDIMYLFLISILPKFNPINIDNLVEFYMTLFKKIFFFYLKTKVNNIGLEYKSNNNFNEASSTTSSDRYRIYEEAIYLVHIQNICSQSGPISRISKQFDEMKQLIIPNELQRLYLYGLNSNQISIPNQKIAILKIHEDLENLENFKGKMPLICRLLRSVRVISDNKTFNDSEILLIRNTIYDLLYLKFVNLIDNNILIPMVQNITDNLTTSLTTGEFIDMTTLTPINISGTKFIDQLKLFLEMILSNLGTTPLVINEE